MGKAKKLGEFYNIGNRVRNEAIKRGFNNRKLADLLNYSDERQICPFNTGAKKYSNEQIKKIADALGLRQDYLLCLDDYPTEADIIAGETKQIKDKYKNAFAYLRSIGFTIEIKLIMGDNIRKIILQMGNEDIKELLHSLELNIASSPENIPQNVEDYSKDNVLIKGIKDNNDIKKLEFLLNGLSSNILTNSYVICISKDKKQKYFYKSDFIKFTDKLAQTTDFIFNTFF